MHKKLTSERLKGELRFETSRSGGPGGQNVNKVNTKVALRWNVAGSDIADSSDKELLQSKLSSHINKDGELLIHAQEKRSQLQNKELALQKLDLLLTRAFSKKKPRRATRPGKGAVEKRLSEKKRRSEQKRRRQSGSFDNQ